MADKEGYWKDKDGNEYYCPDDDLIPDDDDPDDDDDCIIVKRLLKADPNSLTLIDDVNGIWRDVDGKEYYCPDDDLIPDDDDPDDDDDDDDDDDCVIVQEMLDADPNSLTLIDDKGIWRDVDGKEYYCPDVDDPIVPEDPPEPIIPSTPVIVGEDGGVVSIPIPRELRNCSVKFKQPPLIAISGLGTGAIAKPELDEDGCLIDIVVKSKGIGYAPSSGFDQCGILSNMIITNVGGYYESSPTVYVNNDPTIAVAAIQDGRLAEIRIVNPQNKVYNTIPDVRIQGDGFGGSARAVIRFVPCPDVPDEYLRIVNKYSDSKLGIVSVVDCP